MRTLLLGNQLGITKGVPMYQQNSEFYFSRPMTFFGSFEQLDEESEEEEMVTNLWIPEVIDIHPNHRARQTTGLYLHWFEVDL